MRVCFWIGLVLLLLSCSKSKSVSIEYIYRIPENRSDGFETGVFLGDTTAIIKLTRLILADTFPNIHSLLIYQKGNLVYENYFSGKDEIRGKSLGYVKHSSVTLHDCRSITKSITSACVGIAIKKGFIKDEDQPIDSYFPEYAKLFDKDKKNITVKDLLTMTSGFKWNEEVSYRDPRNSELRMDLSSNPYKFVLSRDLVNKPGKVWNYNGGNTELLAEIVHRTSGLEIDQFAETYLFKPLDIKEYEWEKLSNNLPAAASGLRLLSRDLLKLGVLYLHEGQWQGEQVLEKEWANNSLEPFIYRDSEKYKNAGYGYQFWTFTDSFGYSIQEAKGNGGQAIFICKNLDLVVVITAGNYNQWGITNDSYAALVNYIIPAIKKG